MEIHVLICMLQAEHEAMLPALTNSLLTNGAHNITSDILFQKGDYYTVQCYVPVERIFGMSILLSNWVLSEHAEWVQTEADDRGRQS
jgi:hypothetical protein